MSDTSTTARQPLHLYLQEKASVMAQLKHFSMVSISHAKYEYTAGAKDIYYYVKILKRKSIELFTRIELQINHYDYTVKSAV